MRNKLISLTVGALIVLSSFTAQAYNYCSIINPNSRDGSGRFCNNSYGVNFGGYILNNTCYFNLNDAYSSMQFSNVCTLAPPVIQGACRIFNPSERDNTNHFCNASYGILFQGAITNQTCYMNIEDAISQMQSSPYCNSSDGGGGNSGAALNLTINGQTRLTAYPNQVVYFNWNSVNIANIESYYFADRADHCPGGYSQDDFNNRRTKPWLLVNANQNGSTSTVVQRCQSGVSYTMVLVGHTLDNQVIYSQITETIH
jgi:uncharacterized Fe-S cluster protein YjdI